MAGQIVYTDLDESSGITGNLFAGKQFWVAQRIPSRTRYLELIRNNGGKVILLDKKADYKIADHLRNDCPTGSISYTFIDQSIKDGAITDPEAHKAGPEAGSAREVGSMRPAREMTRAKYTAEEDRILYKWVRDYERSGGSISGNEIYKQLEAKHPRHTWQSWRDRYLKQLRTRPPAGLNVPENAPPSPPSDQSAGQTVPRASSMRKEKQALRPAAAQPTSKVGNNEATPETARHVYNVADFDKLFSKEDWEELYANVQTLLDIPVAEYLRGWENWAQGTSQTAEQWRQYFEKVVRPQWQQDSPAKREDVRNQVWQKHDQIGVHESDPSAREKSVGQPTSPTSQARSPIRIAPEDTEEFNQIYKEFQRSRKGKDTSSAYMFWARENKARIWQDHPGLNYTGIHEILMPQWKTLSEHQQAPYVLKEAADRKRHEAELGVLSQSSLTALRETPEYIKRSHDSMMERIHGEGSDPDSIEEEPSRSSKRRKSEELLVEPEATTRQSRSQRTELVATISSEEHSPVARKSIEVQSREIAMIEENVNDKDPDDQGEEHSSEEDEVESSPVQTPPAEAAEPNYPRLPSDSPTPRAKRTKPSVFDTQAILSSPGQSFPIAPLPRPMLSAETQIEADQLRDSSPPPNLESEASTTHSMQEFRDSLNEASMQEESGPKSFQPIPIPLVSRSSSLAPSETDSTGSGDPDPPLTPEEMELFFSERHDAGFDDDEITEALRHTRCRPNLALRVLDAWRDGEKLPATRGIWADQDDEDVEAGDGAALARLEKIHTCDGWGGITERLRFLQNWRAGM